MSSGADAYARARPVSRRTRWREAPLCALDFETTGLDPARDEIISFGAVPIDGGRIRVAGAVEGLVRPRRMPGGATIRVHGILPADLAAAPDPGQALDPLLGALAGRVLVAHAAWVERGFLEPVLESGGLTLRGPVLDTAELGREWRRRTGRRDTGTPDLAALAAELGLPAERRHTAPGDALTTAQAFLALATHLDAGRRHPRTVGSLARTGRAPLGVRVPTPPAAGGPERDG